MNDNIVKKIEVRPLGGQTFLEIDFIPGETFYQVKTKNTSHGLLRTSQFSFFVKKELRQLTVPLIMRITFSDRVETIGSDFLPVIPTIEQGFSCQVSLSWDSPAVL